MLTVVERVLLLQTINLFSDVNTEQLSFLAAIAEEITVGPGRVIYRENDAPDGLYVVVSGTLMMRRGGADIDRIGPGGSFGVWALFDGAPRLTSAETIDQSRLLFISRDDFYEALSDHVDIVEGLFKHLVQRLRKLVSAVEV